MTYLLIFAAFLTGVLVGWAWHESVDLMLGKDDPVSLLKRTRTTARTIVEHRTPLATWAVVLAIALNVVVAGAVVLDRTDQRQLAQASARSSACNAQYNRLNGRARDDRTSAYVKALASERADVKARLGFLAGLVDLANNPHTTLPDLLKVIHAAQHGERRYLHQLESYANTQRLHPYPPPDFCSHQGVNP